MAQAIKYESTSIDPEQSVGEIAALVRRYGGSRFEMRWDDFGHLAGVRFALRTPELGEVPVRLMAATGTIEAKLAKAKPFTSRSRATRSEWEAGLRAQAYRIAWRQMKDFIEQALLAVETGLFPILTAFAGNVETRDPATGDVTTMAELMSAHFQLAPGGGSLMIGPGR